MSRVNPWDAIEAGTDNKLSALRADANQQHDFFWARNHSGNYVFLYSPDTDPDLNVELPVLRGIAARYYPEARQLQLVLSQPQDWELFLALCDDLMRSSKSCLDSSQVMQRMLGRLQQWQRFLSRKSPQILDDKSIRGLIGELIFLRDVLMPIYGPSSVVFWGGSTAKQDFAVGTTLFEVKTYLAGATPKVVISSPDQLWAVAGPLYLAVTCLGHVPANSPLAVTLPMIVADLRKAIDQTSWSTIFEETIENAGYIDLPEYDQHAYQCAEFRIFEVRDGFPMLRPVAIPDGVEDVKYSVHLDRCASFAAIPAWPTI